MYLLVCSSSFLLQRVRSIYVDFFGSIIKENLSSFSKAITKLKVLAVQFVTASQPKYGHLVVC
jgi:hypothetical protein